MSALDRPEDRVKKQSAINCIKDNSKDKWCVQGIGGSPASPTNSYESLATALEKGCRMLATWDRVKVWRSDMGKQAIYIRIDRD